jgi:hypothetical protein
MCPRSLINNFQFSIQAKYNIFLIRKLHGVTLPGLDCRCEELDTGVGAVPEEKRGRLAAMPHNQG